MTTTDPREQWLEVLESRTLDELAINTAFSDLKSRFLVYYKEVGSFEHSAEARENLFALAAAARTLVKAVENIGPGAMRILTSGSLPETGRSPIHRIIVENFPRGKEWMLYNNQPEGSWKPQRAKYDPGELPDYEIGENAPDTRWMSELRQLTMVCENVSNHVWRDTSPGNTDLAEKMGWKRPKDWLAIEVLSFLKEHEIKEKRQSKATTMVEAILDATRDERNDSRENRNIARNAVIKASGKMINKG